MKRWLAALLLVCLLLAGGCDSLPAMPQNPFRTEPTAEAAVTTAPTPAPPTTIPTATPLPFSPYWVKNHRLTEMWSGPPDQPGVISFGTTSGQFCSFQVVEPQRGPRLYVLNPYSRDYFWIDADAVGPVEEPPQRVAEPRPPNQNCAEQVYEG